MAWNNLTFMQNTTTVTGIVSGVNNIMEGWLIGGIMLTLFIIILLVFYGRVAIGEILAGAGFLFSIVSLLFINAGLLPAWIIGVTVTLLVFGLLSIFMSER